MKKWSIFLIIFLSFLTKAFFVSPWFEDWDSVSFAMALHNYSLVDHLPHPPGYPFYILLGKFAYFFFQDDRLALSFLSILLGSLIALPLFLLVSKMFNTGLAYLAVLISLVIPVEWLISEMALTNIPGLFFLCLFSYLIYTADNQKKFLISSFFGGLITGFRITELPIILCLLIFHFFKFNQFKLLPKILLFFILGVSTWIIPLLIITTPERFIQSYTSLGEYVIKHDSAILNEQSIKETLYLRINSLKYLLELGYTKILITISILGFILMIFKLRLKDERLQLLFVWLLSYLLPLILIFNLEVTRYTLPLAVPLSISAAFFLYWLFKINKIFLLLPILLLTYLSNESLSQVKVLKNEIPPSIAPVIFVKENYSPEDIILVTSFIYRQFNYYAPEYEVKYINSIDLNFNFDKKIVILDYIGIKDQLSGLKDYQLVDKKLFNGNRKIYTRLPSTSLYILKNE